MIEIPPPAIILGRILTTKILETEELKMVALLYKELRTEQIIIGSMKIRIIMRITHNRGGTITNNLPNK